MLCNVALNGLEEAAKSAALRMKRGERSKVDLTRFADHFLCTGVNNHILENDIMGTISQFLAKRNLRLKDAKCQDWCVSY